MVMREVGGYSDLAKLTVPGYLAILDAMRDEAEIKKREHKKLEAQASRARNRRR